MEAQERQKDKFEVEMGGRKPKAPNYYVQRDVHSQPHSVTGWTPAHSTWYRLDHPGLPRAAEDRKCHCFTQTECDGQGLSSKDFWTKEECPWVSPGTKSCNLHILLCLTRSSDSAKISQGKSAQGLSEKETHSALLLAIQEIQTTYAGK